MVDGGAASIRRFTAPLKQPAGRVVEWCWPIEIADRHCVSDDAAEVRAREPQVQMERRRLNPQRRRQP
jgi:hypothetical protein